MPSSKDNAQYNFDLQVGQQISITDPVTLRNFEAKVIGADHYDELAAAPHPDNQNEGLRNSWISYTLVSEDAPEHWGNRFWAVDSQKAAETGQPRLPQVSKAFYVASSSPVRPDGFQFEETMSGHVKLSVVGEALYSTQDASGSVAATGTLFTYLNPEGKIWAEEVFVDAAGKSSRMVFDSMPEVEFDVL